MFPLVEQFENGMQPIAAFCAEHGISPGVSYCWRQKYRKETASAGENVFIAIGRGPEASEKVPVGVLYPGGMQIRFLAPVSTSFLPKLMRS